jgi:hypothetical protein
MTQQVRLFQLDACEDHAFSKNIYTDGIVTIHDYHADVLHDHANLCPFIQVDRRLAHVQEDDSIMYIIIGRTGCSKSWINKGESSDASAFLMVPCVMDP